MSEPLGLEPLRSRLRPIPMKRAAVVAVLLLLAGCGSAEPGSDSAAKSKPSPSSTVVVCMAGRLLTKADVDGNGASDEVRLQPPSGDQCPSAVVADIRTSKTILAARLSNDEPPVSKAFAVALPGQKAQLVVTRADHPRGGYQLRVYAAGTDKLAELQADGQSLLPFVASDVQEHPWSIDCSADGLVFTEAVPHEPVGIAPAWDIKQTTYAVDGTTVTKGTTEEIADNVLPKDLSQKYPDLVTHSAFASCRAS